MNSNALSVPRSGLQRLNISVYHGQKAANNTLPLVLLHGWGADSSTFDQLVSRLSLQRDVITVDLPGFGHSPVWDAFHCDEKGLGVLLDTLSEQLPESFDLLGWSLGGMLAVRFAHHYEGRVKHLITLASNAVFVAEDDWPTAMAEQTYQDFCHYFETAPLPCLKQFCGLQAQGDRQQRQTLKSLRQQLPEKTNHNWLVALKMLAMLDNRDLLRELDIPVLHLLGAQDQLVPCSAAIMLSQLNSKHQIEILAEISHPLHLAAEDQVCSYVEQFLGRKGYQLSKQKVAESFSGAASTYDGVAYLQRKVGDHLLARLPDFSRLNGGVKRVLDVGCGTGYLLSRLDKSLPDSELLGFDIAQGMLEFARDKDCSSRQVSTKKWLCGDAELLPLADGSIDLIVSNLAYQWCQHPLLWGAEISRVLNRDGFALVSTLGPQTLYELRAAWSDVDGYVHVNEFMPLEKLKQLLENCGLHCDLIIETEVLEYSNLNNLMRELKDLGAHNVNAGQSTALTGRQRITKLNRAYERFRNGTGFLPATYEVAYLMLSRNVRCLSGKCDRNESVAD